MRLDSSEYHIQICSVVYSSINHRDPLKKFIEEFCWYSLRIYHLAVWKHLEILILIIYQTLSTFWSILWFQKIQVSYQELSFWCKSKHVMWNNPREWTLHAFQTILQVGQLSFLTPFEFSWNALENNAASQLMNLFSRGGMILCIFLYVSFSAYNGTLCRQSFYVLNFDLDHLIFFPRTTWFNTEWTSSEQQIDDIVWRNSQIFDSKILLSLFEFFCLLFRLRMTKFFLTLFSWHWRNFLVILWWYFRSTNKW